MQRVDDDVQYQQQYWESLVERLAAGSPGAAAEFRGTYRAGIRFIMQRRIGTSQLDEVVDNTMEKIVKEISGGRMTKVSEMARLIRKVVPAGRPASTLPMVARADRERLSGRVQTLDEVLGTFSPVEREALICFYARGFSERDVEAEFGYDTVSFRCLRERLVRSMNLAKTRQVAGTSRPAMFKASAAGAA